VTDAVPPVARFSTVTVKRRSVDAFPALSSPIQQLFGTCSQRIVFELPRVCVGSGRTSGGALEQLWAEEELPPAAVDATTAAPTSAAAASLNAR
jgi:hypothetical protein